MNFLQLIASGAQLLNFNFQSKTVQTLEPINNPQQKSQGFKVVDQPNSDINQITQLTQKLPSSQKEILNTILFNERQELINRYLQLNLHLLQGNISKKPQQLNLAVSLDLDEQFQEKESNYGQQKNSSKKKIKKQVRCGHDDKAHYAKGLCSNCYHKYGRTKKPWNCAHDKLYAGGMCQNCVNKIKAINKSYNYHIKQNKYPQYYCRKTVMTEKKLLKAINTNNFDQYIGVR